MENNNLESNQSDRRVHGSYKGTDRGEKIGLSDIEEVDHTAQERSWNHCQQLGDKVKLTTFLLTENGELSWDQEDHMQLETAK